MICNWTTVWHYGQAIDLAHFLTIQNILRKSEMSGNFFRDKKSRNYLLRAMTFR